MVTVLPRRGSWQLNPACGHASCSLKMCVASAEKRVSPTQQRVGVLFYWTKVGRVGWGRQK